MFKVDEIAGTLIKSGRFADAIPVFGQELNLALLAGVVTRFEIFEKDGIIARFNRILLNPADYEAVTKLGNDMIFIALRIPDYVKKAQ